MAPAISIGPRVDGRGPPCSREHPEFILATPVVGVAVVDEGELKLKDKVSIRDPGRSLADAERVLCEGVGGSSENGLDGVSSEASVGCAAGHPLDRVEPGLLELRPVWRRVALSVRRLGPAQHRRDAK